MTDNNDKQPSENEQTTSPEEGRDNKASHDLSAAAAEAMRLLKNSQGSDVAATPESDPASEDENAHHPETASEANAPVPTTPTTLDVSAAADDAVQQTATDGELTETAAESDKTKIATTAANAVSEEEGNTTNDVAQEAYKAMQMEAERQREAELKARSVVSERSVFTEGMRLKLESGESAEPIVKAVTEELIVGRADNVTDYIPDVDLTPHGAYRLGLSRRHAIILRENDRVLVKDLNSRNGTFVNGAIVPGGGTQVIRDGDEVRFGNLAMRVTFISE